MRITLPIVTGTQRYKGGTYSIDTGKRRAEIAKKSGVAKYQRAPWRPVEITRRVVTRAGAAFEPGDLTVARPDGSSAVVALSIRQDNEQPIRAAFVRWLE